MPMKVTAGALASSLVALLGCGGATHVPTATDGGIDAATDDQGTPTPQPVTVTLPLPTLAAVPTKLSATGLYLDLPAGTLATGVRPYQPQFGQWLDGATQNRWVYLPQGAQIDTTNMDRWVFPIGTKLWQELTRGGKRVETRFLWKRTPPTPVDLGWEMWSYVWNDTETEATLVQTAVTNVRGTGHNVSSPTECLRCHLVNFERPVGFSAIQLSGTGNGVRMQTLVSENLLTAPPQSPAGFTIPGAATDQAALGYLHANCGTCHAADAPLFAGINQSLRLEVAKLTAVSATPSYLTTYKVTTTSGRDKGKIRLAPMSPSTSAIYFRMGVRGTGTLQMPPVASTVVDTTGQAAIAAWINTIP